MKGRAGLLAVALVVLVAASIPAGRADAAVGNLTFTGCLGGLIGCPGLNPVGIMNGASGATVSPDGRQLYVGAHFGNAISHFTLDANAVPAFSDCVGKHGGCAAPGMAPDGVGQPRTLALARDATRLYASSYFSDGFSWFTIGASGAPAFAGCFGTTLGCTPPTVPNAMEESEGIVLSPDGTQLYVAAATVGVVGTVSHFRLDANGSPTWANCVGTVTVPGCAPSSPNAALIGARDLVVSADGRHLYVAADGNANAQQGSVSHFTLDANGDPTFAGCLGGAVGCATPTIAGAMTYPSSLALSADGARLYVGANSAVSSLSLDATGGMTFDGCLGGTGCANAAPPTAFSGVWGLELGADGRRLFATSFGSDSVSWLPLDASSLPTFGGCIGMAAACTATTPAQALGGAYDLAPTPDGRRLFVTAYNAQLLDSFDIEQPPGPPRTGPGPGPPADTAPRLTRYKLSRAKFAAAAKGRSVAAAKRPRIKVGTTVRYTLSEVATVTFTVERRSAGRKVKGRCVAARKRNRGRPSCKRYVAVRGSFRSKAARGANRLGFTGRLRARKLPPGSYRLVATARDAAGSKSAARRVRFTIVAG